MTVITIVTPSFNQGEFLGKTIKSIWDQKGDFTIEHIIADGGSQDNSVDVIKRFENELNSGEYPIACKGITLTWWSKRDKGQADAINQGFTIGTGEIFAWLNSDDFYEPGAIAKVISFFRENSGISCVYGGLNFVDKDGLHPKPCSYLSDFSLPRLLKYCYIPQPSTFFRRDVYEKAGELNITYRYAFDYDYWLRIAQAGFTWAWMRDHTLASIRTYPERKTENGLIPMRREVNRIMLNHGYWYAPALLESAWLIMKHTVIQRGK